MGHPIQIISFGCDRKLKLNNTEFEKIVSRDDVQGLPIAILSVIGAFRTGKSFLLNWIERFLSSDEKGPGWIKECKSSDNSNQTLEGFKWRSGSQSETQGIWAWSEVFIINDSAGEKIGVLLIDTQGLFDSNNTLKQNGNIFTLSTLISSIQIFNLSQKMQEDNLGNLELFAEFGRRALTKVNRHSMNSLKPFQRIIFLIRDWPYPKENAYGAQGGRDHLQSYLKVTKEKEGNELGDRRRHVDECFDQVDCYLMPHPGKKVANDDGNFRGRLSEMKEPFKEHLDKFLTFVFPEKTVEPKTVAGSPIHARDLPAYVESYVDLLNSDESLSAQSIFQATAKIHNNALARDSKMEYKALIAALENRPGALFLTNDDLQMNHENFKRTVFEYFDRNQMDDAESSSKMMDQLNKDIEEEFINWKSRNDRLKEQITTLNESALKDAVKMYSTSMNDLIKRSTVPFFSPEELNDQHQLIKDVAMDYLKSHSKGSEDFILPFLDHLKQTMEDHFITTITPLNESKTKMELDRLEMIELEKKRKEEKARRKQVEAEAIRQAAADEVVRREAAEAEAARQVERAEQAEKEYQIQLERQRERAKELLEKEQKRSEEVKRGLEEELRLARERLQCLIQ